MVFADRQIDATTGALLVQSAFPNPDGLLRPGLFARIRATMRVRDNAIRVPQRSVSELQGRFSVFVVNADNKAEKVKVEIGDSAGKLVAVRGELAAGDRVAIRGAENLAEGTEVRVLLSESTSPGAVDTSL